MMCLYEVFVSGIRVTATWALEAFLMGVGAALYIWAVVRVKRE